MQREETLVAYVTQYEYFCELVKKESGPRSPAHERYLMARQLSRIEASASTKPSGFSVRVVSSQDKFGCEIWFT
jgi:hypothetical protein